MLHFIDERGEALKLKCSHDLCIYWEENHCILDFISIRSIGMCEECINISFEEEDLNRRREELRKMFEEIDKNYKKKPKQS